MDENSSSTSSMCKSVKLGNAAATSVAITDVASQSQNTGDTPNSKGVQSKPSTVMSSQAAAASAATAAASKEPEELLGSVTTHNCPGTRASARVIQKMKQDQTRPMTPPPTEHAHNKKDEKQAQKTPSQPRATNKTIWTNLERNCFFDALNEFGKDFEAVSNCINSKLKRRNAANDYSFKTKDQVRQHYYQTYHKICKYVRYSDELKKPVQELYTLINYGEMRRKLQFLTEKHFMKLKQLVYQGQITVRCKGKNIRIKTPSCKALRRLNQLDDSLEDIRLPAKIEVLVTPYNMEAFGRVQTLAQNPRGRAIVPLHKKLVTFIKTFQYKWRSSAAKLSEEKLFPTADAEPNNSFPEPELCFLPKPGVPIHRPLLSITAYLSSVNICLTAYEERLGVKVRSETLTQDRTNNAANNKRPRTESGSEKRSPDTKKLKPLSSPAFEKSVEDISNLKEEPHSENADTATVISNNHNNTTTTTTKLENSSGDELSEEINDFLNSTIGESADRLAANVTISAMAATTTTTTATAASSTSTTTTVAHPRQKLPASGKGSRSNMAARNAHNNFKPLLSDGVIKRIRKGWTVSNAADITIGDLYVVLGQDSKLELEYYWGDVMTTTTTSTTSVSSSSGLPYNLHDCDSVERVKAVTTSTVSNKLKHLLLVANLSERVRKRQCICGHTCERIAAKSKRELVTKVLAASGGGAHEVGSIESPVFRTPMPPMRRPFVSIDPVRQLSSLTRQKMSRQVLVQRRILPPASDTQPYDLLNVGNLQNGFFEPIEQASATITTSTTSPISLSSMSSTTTSTSSSSTATSHGCLPKSELEKSTYVNSERMDMPLLDFCVEATSFPEGSQDETTTHNFFNAGSVSPMHLLRDSTSNARWLEENINDFSLTSLLGHLDEIDATRDILDPSSNLSVISESSVDYRHKFQEFTALLQNQEKD
ncbi:protein cramped [Scaptodrosophila lebanonensis]|uniref:Protein cramped n=1 Tax=Drosophila lebanonensis TaxID=7225 RepID=A0A6J2UE24_DROLE|nr:protein cramped [Scaptodrosophila lebanonensis]